MPFTTSHPAIVMPLKKFWPRHFSLGGLMAGAMSPDLPYFLTGTTEFRYLSHTWTGLFLLCIPLGILFVWGFHAYFKRPVINMLPEIVRVPLSGLAASEFRLTGVRDSLVLVLSVLLGALSHFAWDSFTHPGGFMVARVDFLMQPISILGRTEPFCRLFQHVSSLFGGIALLLMIFRGGLLPKPVTESKPVAIGRKFLFWAGGAVCAGLGAYLSGLLWSSWFGFTLTYQHGTKVTFTSYALGSWAGFFWYAVLAGFFGRGQE
ncbi:MAG: DUF4184 family protein [bacterium]|nr:DUF4184 family protein [bacterium]